MPSLVKRVALYAIDHMKIPISRRYGTTRFTIPLDGRRGLGLLTVTEPELLSAFARLLPGRDGHFIDVGANIGQTLLALRSVEPNRPYLGLEPNVVACAYCQELIWANRLPDAVVLPTALGEVDSILALNLREIDGSTDKSASLRTDHKRGGFFSRQLIVPVRPGDAMIDSMEIDRVAAIKIDTEGTEPAVLRGLSETIRKDRPLVFLEILGLTASLNDDQRAVRIDTAVEVETWAQSAGYELHQIDAHGEIARVQNMREFLPTATARNFLLRPDQL